MYIYTSYFLQIISTSKQVKKMKAAAFLLFMLMASLCMAAPRRILLSSGRNGGVAEIDGTVENHHNIPRQNYKEWGNEGDNSGDNNVNEGG